MHRRLRRARTVTLGVLAVNGSVALFLPAVGVWRETRPGWVAAGAAGVLAFSLAQAFVLYAVVTPWLTAAARRRSVTGFAVAAAASLPLVGPVGGTWPSWAWLAACIVGVLPVVTRLRLALPLAAVTGAAAALTAPDAVRAVIVTVGIGTGIAAINTLHVWFWDLLMQAEQGREAQARLAASEERLRFARDVHDLLGHHLSVIALKAELAERLATVDGDRARAEAAEVRRIAAATLTELREVVHGYRQVDLRDQLAAIGEVLGSSGVRCTVAGPGRDLPEAVSVPLAAVLREATTNLLRHSRATWCEITVEERDDGTRMTVVNDGARGRRPDGLSSGLRGLADRLAQTGGVLRTTASDDRFTVEAVVRPAVRSTS